MAVAVHLNVTVNEARGFLEQLRRMSRVEFDPELAVWTAARTNPEASP